MSRIQDTNGVITKDITDQPTLTELVSGIVQDTQTLFRQQFEMLRAELRTEVTKATNAAQYIGIGSGIFILGSIAFVFGIAYLINALIPQIPLWGSFGIVGIALMIGGCLAFELGRRSLKSVSTVPDKTLNALQENVTWLTKHQN
ncbi:phage holin family protein [Telmatocola sphagniphila]|uniref:Phage holin family protein n=1 Tax=Telmatocola sphagniphila TaxID=1123043 RepID=A0A8E6BCD1_9BACT|nr:phage holin family protein [Telmatocola sphagniphila]QVL34578.1 phage holin family protein [Telmatocola sphagniphila]